MVHIYAQRCSKIYIVTDCKCLYVKKRIDMPNKKTFLENFSKGDSIYFGSNTNGVWDEDGTVWYNSHGLEQFYFDSIEDFLRYWYDKDETVPHRYHYYIGERDDDGNIEFADGYSEEENGIDPDEDGNAVWSEIKCLGDRSPRYKHRVFIDVKLVASELDKITRLRSAETGILFVSVDIGDYRDYDDKDVLVDEILEQDPKIDLIRFFS